MRESAAVPQVKQSARVRMRPIKLLKTTSRVSPEDVVAVRGEGELVACDFYVEGIEHGNEVTGGYRQGRILNIDHHAPTSRMRCRISSTNLALKQVEADAEPVDEDAVVIINHLDCDSILSSGIMSGRLPPDPCFGDAAIAADHTGKENDIADLLQGLDAELSRRKVRDYTASFENLHRLLNNQPLDSQAKEALDARLCKRCVAEKFVSNGRFQRVGPLHFAVVDEPIDGEFFPALLPDAIAIMVANPLLEDPSRWQVKLRLGRDAPSGLALSDLGIQDFDPNYGGRWNAGSNRRGGGTPLTPEEYAERLMVRLEGHLLPMGER